MSNEKIWTFYNEHPSIDIESTNLFFIELMEKSNQNTSGNSISLNSNINSQIIEHIKTLQLQINNINDNFSRLQEETTKNFALMMLQFKKDCIKKDDENIKININQPETNNIVKDTNQKAKDILNRWSTSLQVLNR
ncbi:MAG: hypothetical protein WD512_02875 [Candidatus Paceibacterota bacterium]